MRPRILRIGIPITFFPIHPGAEANISFFTYGKIIAAIPGITKANDHRNDPIVSIVGQLVNQ